MGKTWPIHFILLPLTKLQMLKRCEELTVQTQKFSFFRSHHYFILQKYKAFSETVVWREFFKWSVLVPRCDWCYFKKCSILYDPSRVHATQMWINTSCKIFFYCLKSDLLSLRPATFLWVRVCASVNHVNDCEAQEIRCWVLRIFS